MCVFDVVILTTRTRLLFMMFPTARFILEGRNISLREKRFSWTSEGAAKQMMVERVNKDHHGLCRGQICYVIEFSHNFKFFLRQSVIRVEVVSAHPRGTRPRFRSGSTAGRTMPDCPESGRSECQCRPWRTEW